MSFVRKELSDVIVKWREPLIMFVLSLVPVFYLLRTQPAVWFQIVIGLLALGLLMFAIAAARRVLLQDRGLGQGYLEVSERKISFTSSDSRGVVDVDALAAIDLSTDLRDGHQNEHYWILTSAASQRLIVPGNAHGIEELISVLTSLPNIDLNAAIRFRVSGEKGVFKVWRRDGHDPLPPKLPLV